MSSTLSTHTHKTPAYETSHQLVQTLDSYLIAMFVGSAAPTKQPAAAQAELLPISAGGAEVTPPSSSHHVSEYFDNPLSVLH